MHSLIDYATIQILLLAKNIENNTHEGHLMIQSLRSRLLTCITDARWDIVQYSIQVCGQHDELSGEVRSVLSLLRRLELEMSRSLEYDPWK